ncbi:ATP-dependent helicase [Pengzhenrongella sicca]|uniref:DNA 3'-5' helicase n=1 Tax=Pengzhenrongella sicca TaxID=2819238 RepID=A0A8A4ZJ40_9MICO|nr:ATP-dependent helicase [Pengzhenrongella sicca]
MRLAPPARGDRTGRAGSGGGSRGGVVLDASQQAVVDEVATPGGTGALLVLGAPGTGKTTTLLEAVATASETLGLAPDDVLVLAATRRAAADLRDGLAARLPRTSGQPMVRTAAAAAFAVLTRRAAQLGEPAPTLISGPEQDLLLAELLAGHAAGDGVRLDWPPSVPAAVLAVRAFRDELRDLLMRAAERGLTPADLAALGERAGRPEWVAAGRLYREYLDVTVLRQVTPDSGARFDPAVVVDEAAEVLADWEREVPGSPRPRWRLVVVDDHQESTAATARLLRVLADDGARLVLFADPDVAVQAFRGAAPTLVGRATVAGGGLGELGAEQLVLGTAWRQGAELRAVTAAVTQEIGSVGAVRHRRAVARPGEAPASDVGALAAGTDAPAAGARESAPVRVALLPTAAQEAAYVAHALRSAHLERGIGWDEMAVIARSGGQVSAMRRSLAAASVPVAAGASDLPLRDEPAVRPLLLALRCALQGDGLQSDLRQGDAPQRDASQRDALDPEAAVGLLASALGGMDAVALRRLRRALRAEELAGGGGRSSDALLVELLGDPARTASLPPAVRRGPHRLARVLAAGRAAAAGPGANAQTVLWALWSTAELAPGWSRSALAGGAAGARADRDLDAVLALFRAAETFVDRQPQASARAFVDYLQSQDLPSDSLAARAAGRDRVAVLTPAGAAGREWELVVVVGVQEGTWPDLRLRDSLLGAAALVELVAGRTPEAAGTGTGEPARAAAGAGPQARAAVLADELRSFALATSRATSALLVTAVADADEQPSAFVDLVQRPEAAAGDGIAGDNAAGDDDAAAEDEDVDPRLVTAPAPMDLRGLVGALRSQLEESVTPTDGAPDRGAARLLADLARADVPGADPREWYGLADVSSDTPLWSADEKVPVSPSKAETVSTCALRWALESAGGTAADGTSQTLGTLVHSIAEHLPDGTEGELLSELDRRWPELGLRDGWPAVAERRRADRMVRRLAEYLKGAGEVLLREAPFSLELDRALLRGVVDRVERVGADAVQIVDLKTGKRAPSAADTVENPQLGAYQLAVDGGAFDGLAPGTRSAGAQLVFVSDIGKGPTVRAQGALGPDSADEPSWARTMIDGVATTMAASAFTACVNDLCSMCPVRTSCPAHVEGRQVVE